MMSDLVVPITVALVFSPTQTPVHLFPRQRQWRSSYLVRSLASLLAPGQADKLS